MARLLVFVDNHFLPLVEDSAIMAGMGEDKGVGEDAFPFPPPLTPPTRGGENKDAIHLDLKVEAFWQILVKK